jgi:hypothetical protein
MRPVNRCICLVSLLVTALTAGAVQLGSAKGSAVFGRPLDLTMQVRLDAPFDEAANCFSVDVFQADNKFDEGRVRLDVKPSANGMDATIHLRSVSPVNEPWAKVVLRSNCGAKVSRQYDFLTDFAADIPTSSTLAESAPSLPATAIAATSPSPALAPNNQSISSASNATNAARQAPDSSWSVKRPPAKVKALQQKSNSETALAASTGLAPKKVKPAVQAAVATKKTPEIVADTVGQPRLKMETFELTDEHQVLLKLSSALIAPTGMRTPEEIQALAQATAVWRAINGTPTEVKAATAAATPAPALAPTSGLVNLKLAGKSDLPNFVFYGLAGLLALALGCITWLWLRVRKVSRAGYGWLNDSMAEDTSDDQKPAQSQFFPAANAQSSATEIQEPTEPIFEKEAPIEDKVKTIVVASADNQIVSALPLHFDEPRLEERTLKPHKKHQDLSQDKPTTPPMEPVDTTPKLRVVTAPATTAEPAAAPNSSTPTPKPAPAKDDSKGNLIDFDVFAEPTPADKPSRSAR